MAGTTNLSSSLAPYGDCAECALSPLKGSTLLLREANCALLSDGYYLFKRTWCADLTTAFSYLSLSTLMLGILAGPFVYLALMLGIRFADKDQRFTCDSDATCFLAKVNRRAVKTQGHYKKITVTTI